MGGTALRRVVEFCCGYGGASAGLVAAGLEYEVGYADILPELKSGGSPTNPPSAPAFLAGCAAGGEPATARPPDMRPQPAHLLAGPRRGGS
ncbi:MAG: hypothetical protein KatS3mg051_1523 [Anaerolineae bacterium]|nr:MAG: hypothetical protein KatS3mg051_1523 [Anaerolineae bacterium]